MFVPAACIILWPFRPLSSALSRIIISASCYSLWLDIYSDYKYSDDCSSSFVKNNQWSFASPTLISSYCSSTRHWDEVMFIPKKQSQVYKFQSLCLQVHPGKKWTISIPTSYSIPYLPHSTVIKSYPNPWQSQSSLRMNLTETKVTSLAIIGIVSFLVGCITLPLR